MKNQKLILFGMLILFGISLISASSMTRTLPSTASGDFQVTYNIQSATTPWGAIIRDTVSGGCLFPDGTSEYADIALSDAGTTKTITISRSSASSSCSFSGTYQFAGESKNNFATQTISITRTCTPSCSGKSCGDNGCGGSCGTCSSGLTCNAGQCISTTCTPSCSGKSCGDNGCGGSCGTCSTDKICSNGQCVTGTCPTGQTKCSDGTCKTSCGETPNGFCWQGGSDFIKSFTGNENCQTNTIILIIIGVIIFVILIVVIK